MKRSSIISNELKSTLSPLESDVLKVLLPDKQLKVKEIYKELKNHRKVAHSSIAVILDRLFEKGLVDRKIESCRGGFRYIYHPVTNKIRYEKSIVESAVNKLIEKYGGVALNYFDERFSKRGRR